MGKKEITHCSLQRQGKIGIIGSKKRERLFTTEKNGKGQKYREVQKNAMKKITLAKVLRVEDPKRLNLIRIQDYLRSSTHFNGGIKIINTYKYGGRETFLLEIEPLRVCGTENGTNEVYKHAEDILMTLLEPLDDCLSDWGVRRVDYSYIWVEPRTEKRKEIIDGITRAAATSYAAAKVAEGRKPHTLELTYTVSKGIISETCKEMLIKPTYTDWANTSMEQHFLQKAGALLLAGGLCHKGGLNCINHAICADVEPWKQFTAAVSRTH
jgi:hypothetical protein